MCVTHPGEGPTPAGVSFCVPPPFLRPGRAAAFPAPCPFSGSLPPPPVPLTPPGHRARPGPPAQPLAVFGITAIYSGTRSLEPEYYDGMGASEAADPEAGPPAKGAPPAPPAPGKDQDIGDLTDVDPAKYFGPTAGAGGTASTAGDTDSPHGSSVLGTDHSPDSLDLDADF